MKYGKKMKQGGNVKSGNFSVLNKTKSIDPPKGFHWMEGDDAPHPGAVEKAKFKMADHPKKK